MPLKSIWNNKEKKKNPDSHKKKSRFWKALTSFFLFFFFIIPTKAMATQKKSSDVLNAKEFSEMDFKTGAQAMHGSAGDEAFRPTAGVG